METKYRIRIIDNRYVIERTLSIPNFDSVDYYTGNEGPYLFAGINSAKKIRLGHQAKRIVRALTSNTPNHLRETSEGE